MHRIALILGLIGSVIGLVCAISAFVVVGADPVYSSRLWVAWLALLLPIVAGTVLIFLKTRPILANLIMLLCGLAGFVCINLFYINTFYVFALPFWLLATIVELMSRRS